MNESNEDKGGQGGERDAPRARTDRRPYEPPRIESGPAFERVHLTSQCNEFDPVSGCDIVC